MSKSLEDSIRDLDQSIAGAKAEIKLALKQLPEANRLKLEPLIGTEEFITEVLKIRAELLAKKEEIEKQLDQIG